MTAKKWQITTILLLVAVFVSMVVLMILQSVNNSRLLDYLLENRVQSVSYSRNGESALMLTTYSMDEDMTSSHNDDGIALTADYDMGGFSSGNGVITARNNYSTDKSLLLTMSNDYALCDTGEDYLDIKTNGSVSYSWVPYETTLTYYIGTGAGTYEVSYDGYIWRQKNGAYLDMLSVNGVVCSFTLYEKVPEFQDLPTPPTKVGYTFTGWYIDPECTQLYNEDKITGDINLYAGFRAHTYTVKFNSNNSDGEMADLSMTYDKSVNLPASEFVKEHYEFVGWATSANGGVVYTDGQSVKNLTSTDNGIVTLFAVFERAEWVVTYDIDGEKTTDIVAVNTAITLPDEPSKDGYTFVGWYMSNGVEYTNQPVTSDITLTAKFEIIRCKITFYVDGAIYGTYECDYGTNVADLLIATGVNPVLYRLAPTSLGGIETITADNVADLELTSIGEVVPEKYFPWAAAGVAFAVVFVLAVSVTVIVKAVKH